MGAGTGNPETRGNWPDVDILVIKDYHQGAKGVPRATKADCTLRLHMDVPDIDEGVADSLAEHLKAGSNEDVYSMVMKHKPIDPGGKGAKALRAALDLDDNGKPNHHLPMTKRVTK